ncbi:MAG: ABC transporter substrate-binding protein [Chloroflexota bacterium]
MSNQPARSLTFVVLVVLACTSPTITPTPSIPAPTSPPATTSSPPVTPTQGPSSPPASDRPRADQQNFRIYCCATDPRTLRPQAASGSDELSVIDALQRGLLYRDGDGNLVPSLAADLPTVSADDLSYTYRLRDAQYSDGTSIVAGDIVRAARQLADPRNAFDYGYEMCWVTGAHDLLGMDFGCPDGDTPWLDPAAGTFDDATIEGLLDQLGVTAPDDHTVMFQLYQPTSFWPDITATWLLTPLPEQQTRWAEAGEIVSSGPFVLTEWTHNRKMVLTPNPSWYGLSPTLERLEISIGGDPAAAVAAWERGDLDEARVPSIDVPRVLNTASYQTMVNRSSMLSLEYYDFANCQMKDPSASFFLCPPNDAVTTGVVGGSPTQNVHFRQALTQAIDKVDLIHSTLAGIGVPAYSPTMPGIAGFPTVTADDTPLPFDPATALLDLRTALGDLGVAGPDPADVPSATDDCDADCQHTRAWARMLGPMRFGYACDTGKDQQVLYLAAHWRQALGFTLNQFDVRCTNFSFKVWPPRSSHYDVLHDGQGSDLRHPDAATRDTFACGMRHNDSLSCDPAFDALLDQGARAPSYAASLPFYHQAEELLVRDSPVLFLRYGESISLVRPWVINYMQTPADHQNVGDLFYETIQIAAH